MVVPAKSTYSDGVSAENALRAVREASLRHEATPCIQDKNIMDDSGCINPYNAMPEHGQADVPESLSLIGSFLAHACRTDASHSHAAKQMRGLWMLRRIEKSTDAMNV